MSGAEACSKSKRHRGLRRTGYDEHARVGTCTKDPIGYEGSMWNLYEYANSSPSGLIDHNGLQAGPPGYFGCLQIEMGKCIAANLKGITAAKGVCLGTCWVGCLYGPGGKPRRGFIRRCWSLRKALHCSIGCAIACEVVLDTVLITWCADSAHKKCRHLL